jgi:hypothetical protein
MNTDYSKYNFLKEVYPQWWVKYAIDSLPIGAFSNKFLFDIGLPIIARKITVQHPLIMELTCYDILPMTYMPPIETAFGIFYIMADISRSASISTFFIGIKQNSDEVYKFFNGTNLMRLGSKLNKNIASYLFFRAKIDLFWNKYFEKYPVNRSVIRQDYQILLAELSEEDPEAMINARSDGTKGEGAYSYWREEYEQLAWGFCEWILEDEDMPGDPNARQLTEEEIDEIMNSDDFPF